MKKIILSVLLLFLGPVALAQNDVIGPESYPVLCQDLPGIVHECRPKNDVQQDAQAMRMLGEQYMSCYQATTFLKGNKKADDPDWQHQHEVFLLRAYGLFSEGVRLYLSASTIEDFGDNPLANFYFEHPDFAAGMELALMEWQGYLQFYEQEGTRIYEFAREQYETSNCRVLLEGIETN